MLRLFLILISISLTQTLTCQLAVDFGTEDLSIWSGDVGLFKVNEDQQLQLDDIEGGSADLFTSVEFSDSLSWSIDVDLRFGPSGSNALTIWLAVDDYTSPNPTGYKITLGESGNDDALNLFWVDQGAETLMAQGEMGQVAVAFALQILITKDSNDLWTLATKSINDPTPVESFSLSFQDAFFPTSGDFGITCKYTSTRAKAFYFDNIIIEDLLPDTEGPIISSALVRSATKVELGFNESIEENSIDNANYTFSSGNKVNAIFLNSANTICIELNENLPSGTPVTLTVAGITDENGNIMSESSVTLVLTEAPMRGDLVINELLYDPNSGLDSDFVELINISNKFLSLDDVYLGRANSSASDVQLPSDIVLVPGDIIAFAGDRQEIVDTYQPIPEANIQQLKITNYVNDEGNVWLKAESEGQLITLDSLDYTNDFHSDLLTSDGKEGVSIERISTASETNDPDNWYSASSLRNYATPGYENSQVTNIEPGAEQIELENKVFTPNGDGFEDFVKLNFNFDKPGYVGNVGIYDDHGRLQTRVAENKLLGSSGSIIWEGKLPDGSIAPVGMYIIAYEVFHADGDVESGKKVCVLSLPIN